MPAIFEVNDKGYIIDDQWFSKYLGDVIAKNKWDALEIAKQIWEDADHVEMNLMKTNGFIKREFRLNDYLDWAFKNIDI